MSEWRTAAWGFELYEVSDRGEVRNDHRRLLSPQINPRGYVVFNLYRVNGVRREVRVHRLVLETFVGPMPPGQECRHLNDDKTDNRLENLAYGTRSENQQDAIRNGRHFLHRRKHMISDLEYLLGYRPSNDLIIEAEDWQQDHPGVGLNEWVEAMRAIGALL